MVRISPLAARVAFRGRKMFNLRRRKTLEARFEQNRDMSNIVQKTGNLIKASAKHVADGMRNVTLEQFQVRIGICNGCDTREGENCSDPDCGCVISRKAWWMSEECPEEKWPKLE